MPICRLLKSPLAGQGAETRDQPKNGYAQNCMKLYIYLNFNMVVRSWCLSHKGFFCSKFLISVTQRYRTKWRAMVPNTNYFKPIILELQTFIYNCNSKII